MSIKRVEVWINGAMANAWYQDEEVEVSVDHVTQMLAGRAVKKYSHDWIDGDVYRCDTMRITIETEDYDPDGLKEPGRQCCTSPEAVALGRRVTELESLIREVSNLAGNGLIVVSDALGLLDRRIDVLTDAVGGACGKADEVDAHLQERIDELDGDVEFLFDLQS